MTWTSDIPPPRFRIGPMGGARAVVRACLMATCLVSGLLILLVLRGVERPVCGIRRPVTPWITTGTCRVVLWLAGLRLRVKGAGAHPGDAIVANHSSWLDILALNAVGPVCFVSKAEVAHWPGIGRLARVTGTIFIARKRGEAGRHTAVFRDHLGAGNRLLFFPEGTSTDGLRVLSFKPTLFQAFFDARLHRQLSVQPFSVIYDPPAGMDRRFYGWWGDMEFGPHLMAVLSARRRGRVTILRHPPIRVAETADRKVLARACEQRVRAGLEHGEKLSQTR